MANTKQINASRRAASSGGYRIEKEEKSNMPLNKVNFILMGICGLMIIVGFLLMTGGSTTTDNFNEDIFSTRRIVVGPTIAFLGFVLMAVALMWRKRKDQ